MTRPTWIDAIDEALASGRVTMQFWCCPIEHPPTPGKPTVEWRGDTAHCLYPDCGRTSAAPARERLIRPCAEHAHRVNDSEFSIALAVAERCGDCLVTHPATGEWVNGGTRAAHPAG